MRRSWGCTLTLALALTLTAGCGGGDKRADAPSETPAPSAAKALEDALTRISDAGTARFTAHVDMGTYAIDQAGLFSLHPGSQLVTYVLSANNVAFKAYYVGVDGHAYMSLADDDKAPTRCYLTGSPAKMSALTGIDSVGYGTDIPVIAYVLASARGQDYQGLNEIVGTVDLAAVVSLISSKLTSQLQLEPDEHTVPATFEVRNGNLTSFSVTGLDLIAASRKAGVEDPNKAFSRDVVVRGDIDQVGEPVQIKAPPKKDRIPASSTPAQLKSARARCAQD